VDTPIIVTTSATEIDDELMLFNLGADDYVTKPFLFPKLLAHIRAVLRRPMKIEEEVLSAGGLVVDRRSFKVKRLGRHIDMTPKEFALLVYFVKNKNKVISCEEIMENVWDMNIDILSSTVKTHISNLRKKIDKEQNVKLIHTKKYKGYMFETGE
jgi:DNA-binding response OmpR family regulator